MRLDWWSECRWVRKDKMHMQGKGGMDRQVQNHRDNWQIGTYIELNYCTGKDDGIYLRKAETSTKNKMLRLSTRNNLQAEQPTYMMICSIS